MLVYVVVWACFCSFIFFFFFFFNDTATTEIYTLSLHDALPISFDIGWDPASFGPRSMELWDRSEEHTSELQSHSDLVCRLLLEKKKKKKNSALFEEDKNQHTIQQHTDLGEI